jgi:hypothetical protein
MTPFVQVPPVKPIRIKVETVLQDLDIFESTAYFNAVSDQKRKQDAFDQGSTTMWSVIWNQSSTNMHTELEALDDFVTYEESYDILKLLKAIKIISYKFDRHRQLEMSIQTALERLSSYYQTTENLDDYFKSFKSRCDVIEQFGGYIGVHPIVIVRDMNQDIANDKSDLKKTKLTKETLHEGLMDGTIPYKTYYEAMKRTTESYKASLFLKHSTGYQSLLTELHNQYTQNINNYPATVSLAYTRLVTYLVPGANRERARTGSRTGPNREAQLSFSQSGNPDQNEYPDIKCYKCNRMGHYSSSCTTPVTEDTAPADTISALITRDPNLCFSNSATEIASNEFLDAQVVDPNWIVIDSASTVDLFANRFYLENIRQATECDEIESDKLVLYSNSGISTTTMVGDLPGFGTVWLDENAIANVLSLSSVRKRFRVTQDSQKYDGIRLFRPDGKVLEFLESSNGLFYYDATPKGCNTNKSPPVCVLPPHDRSTEPKTLHPSTASRHYRSPTTLPDHWPPIARHLPTYDHPTPNPELSSHI